MLLVLVASGGFPMGSESLNDLIVFLTMYLRTGHDNRLKIVQGLSILFDSERHLEEELTDRMLLGFNSELLNSSCSDFGYALLLVQKEKKDLSKILFFSTEKVSLNFVKCAFTARKLNIHVDCVVPNDGFVSQISDVLKRPAFCISSEESLFEYLLGILSLDFGKISRKTSQRFCICHSQEIKTGYLCPICLGLYCKFVPLCKNCKTRFIF
ncbi:transcription initiation factor TFIIH subunit 3 [Nematocida minor]|uniref:transcription initiation factor TFIIH subunit 3 n=1 Tax=Nematocida minor TaxID=1912983 RepID=UPI00221EFBA9|nr:transcription initiation factor TFIIH subunit 3 [Nematocida minor]KAI5190405.1 transcription initiation factor TFIIH subunit 3 [Nematocida minor]